jgi:hypothetical protein
MESRHRLARMFPTCLLSLLLLAPPLAAVAASQQAVIPLKLAGVGALTSAAQPGPLAGDEIRRGLEEDAQIPRTGLNASHVPSSHVPQPGDSGVTTANVAGFFGFAGLTHLDQRLAGTGAYANTQFSLEPPDQALCVGNGFVLESVNTALAVHDAATGTRLAGPTALNQFLGLAPEIVRSTPPVFGDFVSDPKCHFDVPTNRWFLTVLQIDTDPATGAFGPRASILIAVSQTGSPLGSWNIFKLDATNDGQNGTPSHAGCPCFGDQPLIGADANGFFVTTNEFPLFAAGFNGAQVYALSKAALAAGTPRPAVQFGGATPDGTFLPLAEGIAYTLQPATVPPGGAFESAAGGTEYFTSALDFDGTLDDRVAVWALTGTASLDTATPSLALSSAVLASEVYGQPPDAVQPDGPRPLAASLLAAGFPASATKLELIAGNDDRMNAAVFAAGKLWSAVNTVVKTPNGPTRVGIAWFGIAPSVAGGRVSGTVATQGYVAVNRQSVLYPSFAVRPDGTGALTFTLVGPDFFPSAAYALLGGGRVGTVHVAAPGAFPEDGFSGYPPFGGARTARWGDYSAAAVDELGRLWLAAEFIPNAPRTINANWGTFVTRLP